jgi:hypothetical protein
MALRLLLNISLAVTVMFFLIVGSLKADISNWTGQNFMAAGSSGVCSQFFLVDCIMTNSLRAFRAVTCNRQGIAGQGQTTNLNEKSC